MPPESRGLVPQDSPTLGGRKEGIVRPTLPLPCRPDLAFGTASGAWIDRPMPVLALRLVYPPCQSLHGLGILSPVTGQPKLTASGPTSVSADNVDRGYRPSDTAGGDAGTRSRQWLRAPDERLFRQAIVAGTVSREISRSSGVGHCPSNYRLSLPNGTPHFTHKKQKNKKQKTKNKKHNTIVQRHEKTLQKKPH